MYLLIDIGNTRIKWQYRDDETILNSDSMMVEDFMGINFSDLQSVKKVLISNVNHAVVLDKIKDSIAIFDCPIVEAKSQSNHVLINDYSDTITLGVDRWLTAIGAWKKHQKPLLVINAGTAITIDLIDLDSQEKPHFKGGMILPGVAISLAILNDSTSLIDVEIGATKYPSVNTTDAVTTGIFTSIQGAVNLVCKKLPATLPILLTGGDAVLIYEQSDDEWKSRIKLEDDLIFEGLMLYI
jgi:pantothenate kinase type III